MHYVIKAIHENGYRIKLTFNSGEKFSVDLTNHLEGEIFLPLKNLNLFSKFLVHPELDTLTWDNGADFAPEFLYELGKKQLKS
ncbi:MAG: DUF2442 domain-containing protein [Bdellovibrio sp.]|nr:DUF2442 domain-containing protein [Bdellovibrio sp.]